MNHDGIPPRENRIPIVGVPRRFGAGHMLVFVTMFALLFSLLRYSDAPPALYPLAALFCAAVVGGQAVLFSGTRPRAASCVIGSIVLPMLMVGYLAFTEGRAVLSGVLGGWISPWQLVGSALALACFAVSCALFGWLGGYLIGTLGAGVFLVMDRKWDAGRLPLEEPILAEVVEETGGTPDGPSQAFGERS